MRRSVLVAVVGLVFLALSVPVTAQEWMQPGNYVIYESEYTYADSSGTNTKIVKYGWKITEIAGTHVSVQERRRDDSINVSNEFIYDIVTRKRISADTTGPTDYCAWSWIPTDVRVGSEVDIGDSLFAITSSEQIEFERVLRDVWKIADGIYISEETDFDFTLFYDEESGILLRGDVSGAIEGTEVVRTLSILSSNIIPIGFPDSLYFEPQDPPWNTIDEYEILESSTWQYRGFPHTPPYQDSSSTIYEADGSDAKALPDKDSGKMYNWCRATKTSTAKAATHLGEFWVAPNDGEITISFHFNYEGHVYLKAEASSVPIIGLPLGTAASTATIDLIGWGGTEDSVFTSAKWHLGEWTLSAAGDVGGGQISMPIDGSGVYRLSFPVTAGEEYGWEFCFHALVGAVTVGWADGTAELDFYEDASNWYGNLTRVDGPIDTSPPSVSITDPQDGEVVSGTVTINASASDNVGVDRVEFSIDNVLKHTDYESPYSWDWETEEYSNGAHTVRARAYDFQGNSADDQITVTLDNPMPDAGVVSIDNPPYVVDCHSPYTPEATVKNFGNRTATFDVVCQFECRGTIVYWDDVTVENLAGGATVQVEFGEWWTGPEAGIHYTMTVNTSLSGDINPDNDTMSKEIMTESTPWPMFRHDVKHTGLSLYIGPASSSLRWSYLAGGSICSSPAMGSDGTIYVGLYNIISADEFLAINPDGTLKWSYTIEGYVVRSSPAIGSDGTIYVGSDNHKLFAIEDSITYGKLRWSYTTGNMIRCSPTIGSDGTIYVGSDDDKLHAINPDGSPKWTFATGDNVFSSPAIGSDGTIYVGSADDKLYAIEDKTTYGSLKWSYTTGSWVASSPAIGSDGTIYVASYDWKLYAIEDSITYGKLRWSYTTGGNIASSPGIGSNGTIYVGSDDDKLYAINPDGSLKWSYTTGSGPSSPAIDYDGTIYVGSTWDDRLYAIEDDTTHGSLKWLYNTEGAVTTSPAIGEDGTIYFGSHDKKLYAIGPGGGRGGGECAGLGAAPKLFALSQNSPNPVSGDTDIRYQLSAPCHTTLSLYDVSGRLVRTLVDEEKGAGHYSISWNGRDDSGRKVANGVYFYRLNAGDPALSGAEVFTATRKLVVLK